MFLTGNTVATVNNNKLKLPAEYHLRRKTLFGKWKDETTLILSDKEGPLNYVVGRRSMVDQIKTDTDSRISVADKFRNSIAFISGNISTLEIKFKEKEESSDV